MKRRILRADGTTERIEVGNGYKDWNAAIGARIGELVVSPDGSLEFWCDEEDGNREEPALNIAASMLVRRQIVGDVIAFFPGDIM